MRSHIRTAFLSASVAVSAEDCKYNSGASAGVQNGNLFSTSVICRNRSSRQCVLGAASTIGDKRNNAVRIAGGILCSASFPDMWKVYTDGNDSNILPVTTSISMLETPTDFCNLGGVRGNSSRSTESNYMYSYSSLHHKRGTLPREDTTESGTVRIRECAIPSLLPPAKASLAIVPQITKKIISHPTANVDGCRTEHRSSGIEVSEPVEFDKSRTVRNGVPETGVDTLHEDGLSPLRREDVPLLLPLLRCRGLAWVDEGGAQCFGLGDTSLTAAVLTRIFLIPNSGETITDGFDVASAAHSTGGGPIMGRVVSDSRAPGEVGVHVSSRLAKASHASDDDVSGTQLYGALVAPTTVVEEHLGCSGDHLDGDFVVFKKQAGIVGDKSLVEDSKKNSIHVCLGEFLWHGSSPTLLACRPLRGRRLRMRLTKEARQCVVRTDGGASVAEEELPEGILEQQGARESGGLFAGGSEDDHPSPVNQRGARDTADRDESISSYTNTAQEIAGVPHLDSFADGLNTSTSPPVLVLRSVQSDSDEKSHLDEGVRDPKLSYSDLARASWNRIISTATDRILLETLTHNIGYYSMLSLRELPSIASVLFCSARDTSARFVASAYDQTRRWRHVASECYNRVALMTRTCHNRAPDDKKRPDRLCGGSVGYEDDS